jgi:hypothetical protein
MKEFHLPDDVLAYFRQQGARGGKARAKKYTPEQLSKMGKKGGRPKGSGKRQKESSDGRV